MGASQSSGGGGGGASAVEVKKSYYELLGIQRGATEDEIKKAYRKKALELHPDRNFGNEEAATKTFAEVQAAHEVLSDPQERAWYDSHESAILRGDDGGDEEGVPTYENVRITTADDLARMVRKFNSNVEFTDAPSGFFGYLRETFDQLAKEEEIAGNWEDVDVPEYPTFGHKDDGYDDVVKRFYAAWSNFSTVKTFAWKDKYRLSEAPDRWYRRRMEQENKKFRQDGVREFNDAVRSLVAFIRKRDPRYVPSTQTEEERQKVLRDAAAAQAVRARAANEAKLNAEVPEWTKTREPVDDELEGNFDEEEEEVVEHVFECVACNKVFKSEKQWEAHEKSKKHQKAVYALQKKMRKENANLNLDVTESGATSGAVTPDEDEMENIDELDDVAQHDGEPSHNLVEERHVNGGSPMDDETTIDGDADAEKLSIDDQLDRTKKDEDNDNAARSNEPSESEAEDDEDDDYATPQTIAARMQASSLTDAANTPSSTLSEDDQSTAGQTPGPKLGKAAQKRTKKAAAAAAAATAAPTEEHLDADHKCTGCGAAFRTKTELFKHLKSQPGHVALKSVGGGGGKTKKAKGKR